MAACYGYERMVKMLLVRGVDPDKPNINGRTPRCLTAWNGEERVVKILLEQKQYFHHSLVPILSSPLEWCFAVVIWIVGVDVVSLE